MKALLERQQADRQFREMMKEGTSNADRTVEERVDHCKHLQYEKHQQLFAVGYTTIHKAAMDNSLSGIKYFLSLRGHKKIDKNAFDNNGKTALHHAAEKGHLDSIQFLIETGGIKVNIRSSYGNTPLMLACKENKVDAIQLLLELKADITMENNCGYTCFHFAAESNCVDAVNTIVEKYITWEHPPKPKRKRDSSTTQPSSSSSSSQRRHDQRNNVTHSDRGNHGYEDDEGSHTGDDSTVESNDGTEADDDTDNQDGDDNSDNDSDDSNGTRSRAALRSKKSAASAFSDSLTGADHSSAEVTSSRAQPAAVMTKGGRILRKALLHKAHNGMTALHIACQQVNVEVAQRLLQQGCDVQVTDNMQETPLHKAGRRTAHVLYHILVSDHRANEYAPNAFRQTPRDLLYDNVKY